MLYRAEIEAAAKAHSLDPLLVAAIVAQESNFCTDAFRWEPKFWARYLAKLPAWKDANPRRVASSYGLMQLMYVTAWELGYRGAPEGLFVPTVGLLWGCRRLAGLRDWAAKGWPTLPPDRLLRAILASWNGGMGGNAPDLPLLRNGVYADQVLARYKQLLAAPPKL